jgi:hypothetical protein
VRLSGIPVFHFNLEVSMDKKAIALSGLSALLLASTSAGPAEAQQKLSAPPNTKMMVVPSANSPSAIDNQRSKSISQASPSARSKLNRIGAESHPWMEKWAQAHSSAVNPVGNVQKTLKQQ